MQRKENLLASFKEITERCTSRHGSLPTCRPRKASRSLLLLADQSTHGRAGEPTLFLSEQSRQKAIEPIIAIFVFTKRCFGGQIILCPRKRTDAEPPRVSPNLFCFVSSFSVFFFCQTTLHDFSPRSLFFVLASGFFLFRIFSPLNAQYFFFSPSSFAALLFKRLLPPKKTRTRELTDPKPENHVFVSQACELAPLLFNSCSDSSSA